MIHDGTLCEETSGDCRHGVPLARRRRSRSVLAVAARRPQQSGRIAARSLQEGTALPSRQGTCAPSRTRRRAASPTTVRSTANVNPLPQELIDRAHEVHLTFFEVAADACRNAGWDPFNLPTRRVGVYTGHTPPASLSGNLMFARQISQTAQYLREVEGFDALTQRRAGCRHSRNHSNSAQRVYSRRQSRFRYAVERVSRGRSGFRRIATSTGRRCRSTPPAPRACGRWDTACGRCSSARSTRRSSAVLRFAIATR